MHRDVIVIGGGYFGCAISYYLARNHLNTLLLEQGEIGSGSSGANFGCVQIQDSEPGLSLELTLEGYKRIQLLEKELDAVLDYREVGSIVVADHDREMEELENTAKIKSGRGFKVELLGRKELKKIEPNLAVENTAGASYSKQGNLNGFKLMYAFLNKGTKKGLAIQEGSKVKTVLKEGDRCYGVELASGEKIFADHIVLTTGAWTKELCMKLGLEVPVEYVKAEAFITEPIAAYLNNYFSLASFFTQAHGHGEPVTSFCCAQTMAGNLLLGETSKPGDVSPYEMVDLNSKEHCAGIYKSIQKYFPSLINLNILRSWVTCSPYTPSMLPVFGTTGVEGLLIAAGFKSSVVLTPIVGELVVDIITGRKIKYDLKEFSGQIKQLS